VRVKVSDAVAEWVRHGEAMGYSPATVKGRRDGLQPLVELCGKQWLHLVSHRDLDTVFASRTWKPGTRNARLGQFKAFFTWCRARGYMPANSDPAFGWRYIKNAPADQLRIPVQEWPALFDACEKPIERVVMATGLYLFLRASEQRRIKISDIDLANSEVGIHRVKTGDFDIMPISLELDGELRRYLTAYSQQVHLQPHHVLLPTNYKPTVGPSGKLETGLPNPDRAVDRVHPIVKRVLARCGYATYWQGEHTLRRSGARAYFDELAENGYDGALRRVQSMLGHKNAVTTEIYLGLDIDRRKRNQDLKGKPMFRTLSQSANVVPIRRES
jgi:integrase